MPQITHRSFQPSTLMFKGTKGCPRTVTFSVQFVPAGAIINSFWISRDKQRLDSAAQSSAFRGLTDGISIQDVFQNGYDTLTLHDCEEDIYGRSAVFTAGGVPTDGTVSVAVESW